MSDKAELVKEVLDEYGGRVRSALRSFLERESRRNDVYQLAADYPLRGGRALRASVCIAAARAFGAAVDEAVSSAVSLELLHSAFLIHDDIEDESEERRGQPALHHLHGLPAALNAGDALLALGLRPLLGNRHLLGPRVAWRVIEEVERMVAESVEGQALELSWRKNNTSGLTDSDYLSMTLKKTCWYTTIYPARVGALIGTRDSLDLDRFVRFGFFLGAAFQIQDDLLNLTGDHTKYGKELAGDLLEGKRTLMLIHLMRQLDPASLVRLRHFLAQSRADKAHDDVSWVVGLMDRYDCIGYARQVAHALAGAAMLEFRLAYSCAPETRDKRFIEALPYWVLERA